MTITTNFSSNFFARLYDDISVLAAGRSERHQRKTPAIKALRGFTPNVGSQVRMAVPK
jgi:hypothetical protein